MTPRLFRLPLALACALTLAAGGCEEDAPPAPEGAEVLTLPSGRTVQVLDVITNAPGAAGATARFRFVVPGLQAADDWGPEMQALCDTYALPRIDGMVPAPQQIVITLADRALPFGEAAPDAVQFFEAYRPENGACIWEMF
jgi:hypothetical protein